MRGALPPLPAVNTGPTPRTRYRSLRTRQSWNSSFWMIPGAVQYSSNDLAAGTTPGTQDIQSALNYQEAVAWKGTDPHTGERVVAASAPIVYHGQTVAVVRYVTSLVAIDWQFFLAMGLACLLGAAILALVYFSNLYFVRSIVEPLASITETARLIADGSYGVQIEKKFDDEVGELTDTINDMSLKIKQSEKTQSEFISSVSHELRTPLTAISGNAEFNAAGVDKGVGLAMLRTKLGIDRMHVIAFGDNENDLEMLEGAGIGVAMGNSKQYVKDAANEVTGDNDHDGVAEFLERFFGL